MRGMALTIVWAFIIATASLVVLLSLMGTFKGTSQWFYCNIYVGISNFFAGENNAALPEFCKYNINEVGKVENIRESNNKVFSRILLAHIIACWESSETKGLYRDHPCYELHLLSNADNVTEYNVSEILINEDRCKSIENTDYGCGVKNQIVWDIDGAVSPSLTSDDVSRAINLFTEPGPLPVNGTMFTINSVGNKLNLKDLLESQVPNYICTWTGCSYWNYNRTTDTVKFILNSTSYTYSVDMIISYLEKAGYIQSAINDQKIILVRYNGAKDAVEVIA